MNKLVEIEVVKNLGTSAKYTIDDFDFGVVTVATADSRGSSFTIVFQNYHENFFYYGYYSGNTSRCLISVDSSKKEIKLSISSNNLAGVSNLIMWRTMILYKFNIN